MMRMNHMGLPYDNSLCLLISLEIKHEIMKHEIACNVLKCSHIPHKYCKCENLRTEKYYLIAPANQPYYIWTREKRNHD